MKEKEEKSDNIEQQSDKEHFRVSIKLVQTLQFQPEFVHEE